MMIKPFTRKELEKKMNKTIKIFVAAVVLLIMAPGCATTKLATMVGSKIAESYQEAALAGTVSADKSISAWPYISGLIRGIFADHYDLDVPLSAQRVINELDGLAAQEELSVEDKGKVIGYFCRLEAMAVQEGWDRYGASITGAIRSVFI